MEVLKGCHVLPPCMALFTTEPCITTLCVGERQGDLATEVQRVDIMEKGTCCQGWGLRGGRFHAWSRNQ